MADKQHLALLKRGVAAWNQWREEHPGVEPNLTGANLTELHLYGCNLDRADLSGTNLSRVNFSEATLMNANLSNTYYSPTFALLGNLHAGKSSLFKLIPMLFSTNDEYRTIPGETFSGREGNGVFGLLFEEPDKPFGGSGAPKFCKANLCNANLKNAHLSGADFSNAILMHAQLNGADLREGIFAKADLSESSLREANLGRADLRQADLRQSCLIHANLYEADLHEADLRWVNLSKVDLSRARLGKVDLTNADLSGANLSEADLSEANLTNCWVYAISAWDVILEGTNQSNLVITRHNEPVIAVDDLEIAQFIYLLLNHKKLRNVLNAVTGRGVLLLGRFGGGGLEVLQAVATKLREVQYLPIIFDFDRPQDRNYTETVKTLAGLSRFIIADLSGPSVPQELYATVPHFKIPFVPILEAGRKQFAMAVDLLEYPWVVRPPVIFASIDELVSLVPSKIIDPAEEKHRARQQLLDELFPS